MNNTIRQTEPNVFSNALNQMLATLNVVTGQPGQNVLMSRTTKGTTYRAKPFKKVTQGTGTTTVSAGVCRWAG